jgi:hypothetical protein
LFSFLVFAFRQRGADLFSEFIMVANLLWAVTNCGLILEAGSSNGDVAAGSEAFRCIFVSVFFSTIFGPGIPHEATTLLKPYLLASAFGWMVARTAVLDKGKRVRRA